MLVPAHISPSNAPQQSPIHRGRCRLAAQVCNGDLRPILEFEFGQDRADVVADRPFPHIGGRGDLLVVEALRDKLDDFVFSIGELGECVRASIRPLGFSGMAGKVDSVYRLALKHAFAAHHLGERGSDRCHVGLDEVAARSELECAHDVLVIGERGQKDNARMGVEA